MTLVNAAELSGIPYKRAWAMTQNGDETPWSEAKDLQRPLPDDRLVIVTPPANDETQLQGMLL